MKTKTIRRVLRNKINSWLESIENEDVRRLAARDVLVTGGSIASMFLGEDVNDYDLYFKTLETTQAVAEYYVDQFKKNPPTKHKNSQEVADLNTLVDNEGRVKIVVKSAGIAGVRGAEEYQYFEQVTDEDSAADYVEQVADVALGNENSTSKSKKYRPVFLSSNAITLSGQIQIVIRFYGDVRTIHENYDFVHCTCSYDYSAHELYLPNEALECLLARELRYKSSKYPLCSIIRTKKFVARGWKINAGQFVKMAFELNALDLTNVSVLEDQLTGVDDAYFHELIACLKAEQDKRGGKPVDSTYLMEVIGRIF